MRTEMIAVLLSAAALGGCATAQGMEHHDHEPRRDDAPLPDDGAASGSGRVTTPQRAFHNPAEHGGMSHEEMMQHCAEMRPRKADHTPLEHRATMIQRLLRIVVPE